MAEEAVVGRPGAHLADASRDGSLVVLGRRRRHALVGPHIGPVTHEVLHRATAPVAVVPHDGSGRRITTRRARAGLR
ncbi:universal stress protein [Streptomyces sp. NPDC057623]|uniref:universal stress protein n=1 Tax=Streptomyces sp. NPDC057623 TaxID=3346187 RepID=UPI0036AF9826